MHEAAAFTLSVGGLGVSVSALSPERSAYSMDPPSLIVDQVDREANHLSGIASSHALRAILPGHGKVNRWVVHGF